MNSTKRFIAEEIAYMFQKFEQTVLKFAQASDERKSHAVEEQTRKKKKKNQRDHTKLGENEDI